MTSPNLTEVVTTTLRRRQGRMADNVLNHNALLRRLKEKGNVSIEGGGRTLVEELEYAENGTFKYYSGYEGFDLSINEVFSAAEYDWKQAAVVVQASGRELRINKGKEQSIKLFNKRIKNAEKTMMNNLSTGIYSDGTGSSGKQIDGLQAQVADDPTSGTVGSINRASFSFWQNSIYDLSVEGVTIAAGTMQGAMNGLWLRCIRGSDKPDMAVAGATYFNYFWGSMQAIQRITSDKDASSGFSSLMFNGPGGSCPVFYDDGVSATRMYFLNTDYLHYRVHEDANMSVDDERKSVNQDAVMVPVLWMGNLTMSNASLQGVMHA